MVALRHPLPGASVTRRFGTTLPPIDPLPHTGTDFAFGGGSCGRRALAAAAGTARRAENVGGGHGVLIDHGDGTETGYWHLQSQMVSNGQRVTEGQVIGLVGASGSKVTGCHLHFEVKVGGQAVDPERALAGQLTAPAAPARRLPRERNADGTWKACPAGYHPVGEGGLLDTSEGACELNDDLWDAVNDPGWAVTEGAAAVIGPLLPVIGNLAIIAVALLIGWTGVKQVVGVR